MGRRSWNRPQRATIELWEQTSLSAIVGVPRKNIADGDSCQKRFWTIDDLTAHLENLVSKVI